jgi:AcrR family transcriptional regulator
MSVARSGMARSAGVAPSVVAPLTPRGQRTRTKLIKSARALFEKNGYLDTNINDIARHARVAYGTFYTYFSSKEEIFAEVVTALVADFRAIAHTEPRSGDGPAARIARANRAYLMAYQANAAMMAVLEQAGTFSPRLAEIRREARVFWVERAQRAIDSWQRQGLVNADIDPYYAATALGSMIDRSAYVWIVLGERFDLDTAVDQLTRLYCAALGLPGPSSLAV